MFSSREGVVFMPSADKYERKQGVKGKECIDMRTYNMFVYKRGEREW